MFRFCRFVKCPLSDFEYGLLDSNVMALYLQRVTESLVIPVAPDASEWLSFHPGRTGWAVYRSDLFDADQTFLFVRFGATDGPHGMPTLVNGRPAATPPRTTTETGAIIVREALVSYLTGVGPRVMRDLPLARIEAAVNQPVHREALVEHLPPVNAAMLPFPWDEEHEWWFATPERTTRRPRLKLKVPAGRPKPDQFYAAVAERFAYLATVSNKPATDLAEANDVEPKTVHGWVKEARRRGFLPPGERSRRGGDQS